MLESLLPILVYFLVGLVLRRSGLADAKDAAFLFRLILFVTLPALVFETISATALTGHLILLPLTGLAVNLACMGAALAYARAASLTSRDAGLMLLGAAVTNGIFHFTFVSAALGERALAEAILVDLGNAIFVATFAYAAASYYGDVQRASVLSSIAKTLRSPIFVALAFALFFSLSDYRPPALADSILFPLGKLTLPLTITALGISFSNVSLTDPLPMRTVLLRMPLGLAVGFFLAWLFGFQGTTAVVVLVAAGAPIGFSSVTLASVARLDSAKAVGALSLSVAVGLFSTPLLLWAGLRWFDVSP